MMKIKSRPQTTFVGSENYSGKNQQVGGSSPSKGSIYFLKEENYE